MISTRVESMDDIRNRALRNEDKLFQQVDALLKGQNLATVANVASRILFQALTKMHPNKCAEGLASLEEIILTIYQERFRGYLNEQ